MSDLISRRDLFSTKIFKTIFNHQSPRFSSSMEKRREENLLQYFDSPLHSYPLLNEMPLDMLIAEARAKDITTEGRSKNEIARDLFLNIGFISTITNGNR
ncbi:MAG: hypothetical protein NT140_05975 [Deltaproteobacteria bacterium]|nr:hypothetical protein [Deltaproteobacteria bacterium]